MAMCFSKVTILIRTTALLADVVIVSPNEPLELTRSTRGDRLDVVNQETSNVITEYVLFDLPAGISRQEVIDGMYEVAPRWQKEPNLIRKTFVLDEKAKQAGAFYLWKDRASAEAAHDEAWRQRVRSAYGSEPQVRYFDTPLVVDNALGKLVE